MPEWSPEVVVDAALARRLVGGQFPALQDTELTLLSEGWDNTVWLADHRWVFRFPRREVVVAGLRREIAVLPGLRLPLPVPRPELIGEPAEGFPFPFFGARLLPGREPLGLSEAQRTALGRPLAEFLRALHAQPADGLPVDPMARADPAVRVPRTEDALARLEAAGLWQRTPAAAEVLAAAAALPPPEPQGLAHGDLHLRHLLVDGHGAPSAVIDWIDVCRADPAVDLPLYWCLLSPAGRAEFRASYPVSEEQLLRARLLALNLCAILALYAHDTGDGPLLAEALAGLRRSA
jgi:aminoglycoside phosphotransferase (APT) family kinase protein